MDEKFRKDSKNGEAKTPEAKGGQEPPATGGGTKKENSNKERIEKQEHQRYKKIIIPEKPRFLFPAIILLLLLLVITFLFVPAAIFYYKYQLRQTIAATPTPTTSNRLRDWKKGAFKPFSSQPTPPPPPINIPQKPTMRQLIHGDELVIKAIAPTIARKTGIKFKWQNIAITPKNRDTYYKHLENCKKTFNDFFVSQQTDDDLKKLEKEIKKMRREGAQFCK